MMKKLLLLFIVLLAAIWLGLEVHKDPGYMLVTFNHWSFETSFWIGTLIWFLSFVVLYAVIRLLKNVLSVGGRLQRWSKGRNDRKARHLTSEGLCELAEGHWQKAEQELIKSASHNPTPLINYLGAARAAQAQQAYDRRDNYLRKAHKSTKGSTMAVGLTQAQLQIDSQQWEQALATLKHCQQLSPNHRYTLKLLKTVYLELKDWAQLNTLLPTLRQHQLSQTAFEQTVYVGLLSHAAQDVNNQNLEKTWEKLPRRCYTMPKLVGIYARHLIQRQADDEAVRCIEVAMKKQWDGYLANLYGQARATDVTKQLKNAEAWLKKHPQEPLLLLCLGQLTIHEKLWGKARHYLEQSIQLKPTHAGYYALGQVLETLGETDQALNCYRQGLQSPTHDMLTHAP